MKKLLLQFSIFSILIVLISITILLVNREVQLMNSWKINSSKKHILFVGDSHIEVSIDDNNSNPFYTLAQSGDCYLYTYSKLKKFLSENPLFDTVYLSIDYHNIDKTSEEWYTSQSYLDFKFPTCFPFLMNEDIHTLYSLNSIGFLKSIPYLLTISEKKSGKEYLNSFGSYRPIDSVMNIRELNKEFKSKYINKTSDLQFLYLEKIRLFCKENNKVFILITVPIHKSVIRNSLLEKKIEDYVELHKIIYFNYRDYNISEDGFSDKFHLNIKGSHSFTSHLLINRLSNE